MYTQTSTMEAIEVLMADDCANWTYEEAAALVQWYEELEECTGPIEFCAVSIRCDWASSNIDEAIDNYSNLLTEKLDTQEDKLEWLSDYTQVITLKNDNIIYIQF